LRDQSVHGQSVLRCGAFFFLILFSYFLLRSVREAMGVQRGAGDLQWLFLTTLGTMAVVNIVFGKAVSLVARRLVVPVVFGVAVMCLVLFAFTLLVSDAGVRLWTGYAFYVWLSVFNLFAVSVFWIVMLDLFSLEQGKKLFPVIGIGGTLGAFCGSALTMWLASGALWAGTGFDASRHLPPLIMLVCVAGLIAAAWLGASIHRAALAAKADENETDASAQRVPGAAWSGLVDLCRSPYLAGTALYIGLIAVSSTILYFVQADIITREATSLDGRIGMFSGIDLATQGLTLLVQAFVTARLLRHLGTGWTLAILPLLTLGGILLLWIQPVYGALVIVQALHRATRYAIARPARETLFSVLSDSQRYRAKSLIDTFVYRAGDAAGLLFASITTLGALLMIVAPLAGAWALVSLALGWSQARRRLAAEHFQENTPEAAPASGAGGRACAGFRTYK